MKLNNKLNNPLQGKSSGITDTVYENKVDFRKISRLNNTQITKLKRYIASKPHEIYGSFQASAWGSSMQRQPQDLDIQVNDVKKTQNAVFRILKESGYTPRLKYYPEYGSQQIVLKNKQTGEWDQIVDIQPMKEHQKQIHENISKSERVSETMFGKKGNMDKAIKPQKKIDGFSIQTPSDQMNRKRNVVIGKEIPQHRVEKDTHDYLRTQNDIRESESVKRKAAILRGDYDVAMEHPRENDQLPSLMEEFQIGIKASRMNATPERKKSTSLDEVIARPKHAKQLIDPIPQKVEKEYYKEAMNNPDVSLDDIDIMKEGNIQVKTSPKSGENLRFQDLQSESNQKKKDLQNKSISLDDML